MFTQKTKQIFTSLQNHCGLTAAHSIRVARFTQIIENSPMMFTCGLLHDIGKLSVPVSILQKAGPLTDSEYDHIQRHASIGANLLSEMRFPVAVVNTAKYHHEAVCGNGYPCRPKEIPREARIVAVADVWAALTEERPYRSAYTEEEATGIMLSEADKGRLDMSLVGFFLSRLPHTKRESGIHQKVNNINIL